MIILAAALVSEAQESCNYVTFAELSAQPPPAIFVVGERPSAWPDTWRAARLARRLAAQGPVTLALTAIPPQQQPVLDDYASGKVAPGDLPGLLNWSRFWPWDYGPYRSLVTGALWGAKVVAVGQPIDLRPADQPVPLPPGYPSVLETAYGEAPVPVEAEPRLVETVAWYDHRVAQAALSAWNGRGYLVIVADRLHVEGGKGIGWQLQRLAQAPVQAVVLKDADGPCFPGDQVWR